MVDLHIHSLYSDGSLHPKQIVNFASQNNIQAISITDHDSIDAYKDDSIFTLSPDVEIIPGIEMTSYQPYETHILGYFIDIKSINFQQSLTKNAALIKKHNILFYRQLYSNKQILLSLSEMLVKYPDLTLNNIISELFIENISFQVDLYRDIIWPFYKDVKETLKTYSVISIIREYGGIPVLAHLKEISGISQDLIESFVVNLIDYGLLGIECYHESYSETDVDFYLYLAKKHNLLVTGGSDFHGETMPTVQIGTGRGNLNIPNSIINILKKRRLYYGTH